MSLRREYSSRGASLLLDLVRARAEATPDAPMCVDRQGDGWSPKTCRDFWDESRRFAAGLRRLGLADGDRLAIFAGVSTSWEIANVGTLLCGGIVVGLEPHAAPEQIRFILDHSEANGLVVDDVAHLAAIPEARLEELKFIVDLGRASRKGAGPSMPPAARRRIIGVEELLAGPVDAEPIIETAGLDDQPATILYTSGTTGGLKGVVYRHRDLRLACDAILEAVPELAKGEKMVCWLPLANIFQRVANLCTVASGGVIYFVSDPASIIDRLAEIQPSVFIGVPRFYEKLHQKIHDELRRQASWRRGLVRIALAVGSARARRLASRKPIPLMVRAAYSLMDALVLRRLRAVLGGSMKFMFTGSAPTPKPVLSFFHAIGLPLLEGYALTENAVPIAMQRPGDFQIGTVGKPLRQNEVRISPAGEIFVRGPGVFAGYHRAESSERFTADGYLRTGDLGFFGPDGALTLVGRLSDVIKTSTGRKIAPSEIESVFNRLAYVDRSVVFGDGQKRLVGLMALEADHFPGDVRKRIRADVAVINRQLPAHQQVWSWAFAPELFSVKNGLLTRNLKLRRKEIEHAYRETLAALFSDSPSTARGAGASVVLRGDERRAPTSYVFIGVKERP